jgi:predicted  nucleic acid-binding Zn-ribbon protein
MWAVMKALTIGGMATQFTLFRKGMGLFAILKTLGAALVVAWATTWETLKAIAAAGWALLRAQAVVGAIAQVGIFSRLRSALVVIWTTTAAAGATIWRGMALGMVAFGRAGITGLIGVFRGLLPILATFGRFLLGPWGIAIAAIAILIAKFHTQIVQVFNNIRSYISSNFSGIARMFNDLGNFILKVFNMLPQGVQNAMLAVVQIVHDAAMAVYQLFSYINPFAQHSPSLVDNVKNGMDRIMSDFARLKGIKAYTDAAYKEIARFGKLTAGINMNAQMFQQKQDRKTIAKAGGSGAALASFDRLTRMVNKLTPVLNALNAKMQAQQQVVNMWQAKLDLANNKLDRQQKILDGLNNTLGKYNDKLSAAQDRLSQYASAPLKGMQAMDDQIQANTVAQNKLKLAMMDTADKAGGSLDDLKSRLDKINGAQEMLRGKRTDLALGGAGSDILSTYDDQIKALDKQKVAYNQNASALSDMQAQLDASAACR